MSDGREGGLMGVATQNSEDTWPRRFVPWTLHREGTPGEFLRIALPARAPADYPKGAVVIRCYQGIGGETTMAIEAIQIE